VDTSGVQRAPDPPAAPYERHYQTRRSALKQLPPPLGGLVRTQLKLLGQFRQLLVFAQRRQGHLRLERRRMRVRVCRPDFFAIDIPLRRLRPRIMPGVPTYPTIQIRQATSFGTKFIETLIPSVLS